MGIVVCTIDNYFLHNCILYTIKYYSFALLILTFCTTLMAMYSGILQQLSTRVCIALIDVDLEHAQKVMPSATSEFMAVVEQFMALGIAV